MSVHWDERMEEPDGTQTHEMNGERSVQGG